MQIGPARLACENEQANASRGRGTRLKPRSGGGQSRPTAPEFYAPVAQSPEMLWPLIQRSLVPQCLASFRKDESFRITRSDVIVVADAGDFIFYDCVYEELLQALGPINDTSLVPWTMFNDNVQMGFFDIYDQYILNVLYDPRVQPGMDTDEVRAVLPQIMPAVRAWVARVNDLDQ